MDSFLESRLQKEVNINCDTSQMKASVGEINIRSWEVKSKNGEKRFMIDQVHLFR